MKFLSCRNERSVLIDEQEPAEVRALLNSCGPSGAEVISSSDQKPVKLRVFSFSELETATRGFGKVNVLGKGSHGCLYKGTLKDGKLVVVKRQESLQDEAAFNNELEILSTLHSPRLVNLVGFSRGIDAQEKLLVVDFMANGSLQDILHSNTSTAAEPLGWAMRVQIALQIAKALLALHSASPPVVHRDVKSSSVFIDSKWNAKLGDFGLALRGHNEDVRTCGEAIEGAASPTGAEAVECGEPEDETPDVFISTEADVFSFGILLLEILSGRNAIDVRFKPPSILDWALPLIKQGKAHAVYDPRLILLPEHCKALRLMASSAARCVRRSSLRRPSMSYVVAALQEVSKKIPSGKWPGGLATVVKMTGCQTPHVLRDVRTCPEVYHGPRAHSARQPRVAIDKPVPSGKATPPPQLAERAALEREQYYHSNETLGRFVGQASSMDRMIGFRVREQRTRSARELSFFDHQGPVVYSSRHHEQKEEEGENVDEEKAGRELPRALTERSLGGRKIVYNQWRNPMFDVQTKSPERVRVIHVDTGRPIQRVGSKLLDGPISRVRFYEEEVRPQVASSRSTTPTGTATRAATGDGASSCIPSIPLANKTHSELYFRGVPDFGSHSSDLLSHETRL